MRLLMTTDTVGGVWTFTCELTQYLLQRGHTIHLVSFGRTPSAEQQSWADALSNSASEPDPAVSKTRHLDRSATASPSRGAENPLYSADDDGGAPTYSHRHSPTFTYTASHIPLEWMQNNEGALEEGERVLLTQIHTFLPDLILSNQFCFGRLDTRVPRILVAHSDVLSWAHACRPAALEPTPWLDRYIAMVQAGLCDAAAVIAPTAWMGSALKEHFTFPQKTFVIPNGLTLEPAPEPVPRKLQAITAGRLWDEAKGIEILRDIESPIPLLLAGDTSLDPPHQQASWPAHLSHLGPLSQTNLHRHFRQSAIYLCTSLYEPFGLAPLEAALCGCAVIARDLPSLREVWDDGALYFTDASSLQATLQWLAASPDSLAQAQRCAHFRATQYTAERMTDSYLHLFQTVLQQAQVGQHVT